MRSAHRYAVFYAPPEASDLARFAAAWLGWNPASGEPVPHPHAPPLSVEEVARFTEFPRRYGFHGTLKAPFRLADGCSYGDLAEGVERLAASLPPVTMPGLALSRLGRFIALTACGEPSLLNTMAERVAVDLDPLRAPLNDAELAKRRKSGLTARQDDYLRRWGYPYVLDEFRFHLTLTGPLPPDQADRAEAALRPLITRFVSEPLAIDDVCLFADPGDGSHFRIVDRFALTG